MTTRRKPNIDLGNITKKRDREFFQTFVLEVITDTFINEYIPTSASLDSDTQTLFTLFLQKSDYNSDGDYDDGLDVKGYRFVYEDLVLANVEDYIDVYLYGVKQSADEYSVEVYRNNSRITNPEANISIGDEIRIVFSNSITLRPLEVSRTDFEIKGKIEKVL
jgi:hypothetical protein